MRYLKITVRQNKPGTGLVYPTSYQEAIGNYAQDHLYYEGDDGGTMLLLSIKDEDWRDDMIRTDVNEITEAEAVAISEAKEERKETVTNDAMLRRLEIKSRISELTQEDLDAIDPDKVGGCIERVKIFADRVEDIKGKELKAKLKEA